MNGHEPVVGKSQQLCDGCGKRRVCEQRLPMAELVDELVQQLGHPVGGGRQVGAHIRHLRAPVPRPVVEVGKSPAVQVLH